MIKIILFIFTLIIVSCGRPHSTDQESNEVIARERLAILNLEYQEIVGNYIGSFELIEDQTIYNVKLELRLIQDLDPSTNLPLKPKLIGTLYIFEMINDIQNILATYGITDGIYDKRSQLVALDIADKFKIRGDANVNILNGILHSNIKGDVGLLKLVRK